MDVTYVFLNQFPSINHLSFKTGNVLLVKAKMMVNWAWGNFDLSYDCVKITLLQLREFSWYSKIILAQLCPLSQLDYSTQAPPELTI